MSVGETIRDSNTTALAQFKRELEEELLAILDYWSQYTIDHEQGGFYGSVNSSNQPDATAPKGLVLNSRILWAFSAGYGHTKNIAYLDMANRAYDYIQRFFIDREYGGAFWSVDHAGQPLETRKQIYGLAFCIYGLTEYYTVTKLEDALDAAKQLYQAIEHFSHDTQRGGYIEAFTREWMDEPDLRLSEKDDNERKTTNTHLHVLEAYTNLYATWKDERLLGKIIELLNLFDQRIISNEGHLQLFFDDDWRVRSSLISYGHDIEAAWLLLQCARVTGDERLINRFKQHAVKLADGGAEGLDADGGLWYEYEPSSNTLIREKHSWPQAEAMIGLFNALQLTGRETYLHASLSNWEFVKQHIRHQQEGEWYWGVQADYTPMQKEKAGFWKCPYHNSRACIELSNRVSILLRR